MQALTPVLVLRSDPLEAIAALSNSFPSSSGAPSESIAALRALGQAFTKGLTAIRSGGAAKLAKPFEEDFLGGGGPWFCRCKRFC